jgi:hypothetical protein
MNNGKRPNQSDISRRSCAFRPNKPDTQHKISPVGGHFWRQWGELSVGIFLRGRVAELLHASGVNELVGREEELEVLLRRWSKAKDRRRSGGAPIRRTGDRQLSIDSGALLEQLVSHTRACDTFGHRSTLTARFTR